jgi:rhamnulokinase
MKLQNNPQLKIAKHLLFMPDLFNFYLTGIKKNEYTIASTSSLLDAKTKNWSKKIIKQLGLPQHIFCEIAQPTSVIGKLKKSICEELKCNSIDVIATGSHDTANAAFTTYTKNNTTAFLSSGTWSLLGVHLQHPVLTKQAMQAGFTNEGGINNNIRFLKNISGLWILQRLVKEWQQQENIIIDYNQLAAEAALTKPINTILDTNDKSFTSPASMSKTINDYCKRTRQRTPKNKGEYAKTVLQSLVAQYKTFLQQIEKVTEKTIEQIHIVGGGSQNQLLNQLTANATKKLVIAGPAEATAVGNIIVQAISKNEIKNMQEASSLIQQSFALKHYQPQS